MTQAMTPLADDFAVPDDATVRARWTALVEKTLKGQSFDEALTVRTPDGLTIQPLYTAKDGAMVARDLRARDADRPWDLRMQVAHADPERAGKDILVDLQNGAASVLLAVDPTGAEGVAIGSADDMAKALDKVLIDLAPVALDAGYLGPKAADWLGVVAKAAPNAPMAFHMDPLTAFAESGASPGPIESHIFNAATVGARLATTYAKASLFLATGRAVHEAGGSNTEELAMMTASALAYAKALVRSGLSMEEAFGRITLGVSLDGDRSQVILEGAAVVAGEGGGIAGPRLHPQILVRQRLQIHQDGGVTVPRLSARYPSATTVMSVTQQISSDQTPT